MVYNLLINGVYWGYNPFTNFLTNFQGDIQVVFLKGVGILPTLVSNFYVYSRESRHVSGISIPWSTPNPGGVVKTPVGKTTKDGSEIFVMGI